MLSTLKRKVQRDYEHEEQCWRRSVSTNGDEEGAKEILFCYFLVLNEQQDNKLSQPVLGIPIEP